MSVMGFQKKFGWGGGVGVCCELYPVLFWIFSNFAKPLTWFPAFQEDKIPRYSADFPLIIL